MKQAAAISIFAISVLSACGDGGLVSRAGDGLLGLGAVDPSTGPALDANQPTGGTSEVINSLLNRRSVLPDGPFSKVAAATLAANSRAAEADLRAARLRAEARAKNWLPSLGPTVSLTSLGDVVSALVVEQVLFDNGRKKAERDYAASDVDVAAVTLAQDSNTRVLQALTLYLNAEQASARAAVNAAAMDRMEHFAWVMDERVKGGVSAPVDARIVHQKLAEMSADMASDREAAAAARAELAAMTTGSLDGVSGLTVLGTEHTAQPLSVMKAQAEAARTVAEVRAARAGFLPGLTASGTLRSGGSDGGLGLSIPNGLGFGMGANIAALEQQEAAASARVGQTQEEAARRLAALNGELASLNRQAAEAQTLAAQAAANYDTYAAQQRAGQRAVPAVVSVFETKVRTERDAVGLAYDAARVALEIAAFKGVLVNGDEI